MSNHNVIGIDLAKSVFQVAISSNHKISTNNRLNRNQLKEFLVNSNPADIFMEACYSAHYWGRFAERAGHRVKLIPAQHVAPFTRGNKNDANDAVAIIEASRRPNLRFVEVKTIEQQDIQSLHRLRERLIRNRTSLINQTRGLLAESGIVFTVGKKHFLLGVQGALNDQALSELFKRELHANLDELEFISKRISQIEAILRQYVAQDSNAVILHSIPGIGVVIASALASKYSNPSQFEKSRDLSVHLGLTPRLVASGDRQKMLGITKRGDRYIRKQLIHGARALMMFAPKRKNDALCQWALRVKQRRGYNVAVVALANRMARLAWTLLNKQETYRHTSLK